MSGAYFNEYDPKAAAWIRELIRRGLVADGVVDERSILDVQPDDLRGFTQCHFFAGIAGWSFALRLVGWPDDRPVWTGSPPCQPFSAAGRQKGKDDERHLAPHFAALVAECRPSVLFGEQVASAAVFGKAASGARKAVDGATPPEWAWLDDLFERLEAAHYACGASDIPAAGVGAAHIRQRTFFGACRLADAADAGFQVGWGGSGRAPGSVEQSERLCADGGLADASRSGRQQLAVFAGSDGAGSSAGQEGVEPRDNDLHPDDPRWPDAADSPWTTADRLFCRDGKWRPVMSGTFPLAHGVPARVVRLRGYGNAIVPQAAAEFIKAFDAAITDVQRNPYGF